MENLKERPGCEHGPEGNFECPSLTASKRTSQQPDQLEIFHARAWARATLCAAGELGFNEAIGGLLDHAEQHGLVDQVGQREVERIIASAFGLPDPQLDAEAQAIIRRWERRHGR